MQNRKIEFRGKRIDTGEWVKGSHVYDAAGNSRIAVVDKSGKGLDFISVIPETVGQNTGLPDCLGNLTFENDKIVDSDDDNTDNGEYYLIVWDDKQARFRLDYYGYAMYRNEGGGEEFSNEVSLMDEDCNEMSCVSLFKVIGNVHDNPELIKK